MLCFVWIVVLRPLNYATYPDQGRSDRAAIPAGIDMPYFETLIWGFTMQLMVDVWL